MIKIQIEIDINYVHSLPPMLAVDTTMTDCVNGERKP